MPTACGATVGGLWLSTKQTRLKPIFEVAPQLSDVPVGSFQADQDALAQSLGITFSRGDGFYDRVDHDLCQRVFPPALQPYAVADLVKGGTHDFEVVWIDCSPCERHDQGPMTIKTQELFSRNIDVFKFTSGRSRLFALETPQVPSRKKSPAEAGPSVDHELTCNSRTPDSVPIFAAIGIGVGLAASPSHTIGQTGPYPAVRWIKRGRCFAPAPKAQTA
jgi:hypothetical protein